LGAALSYKGRRGGFMEFVVPRVSSCPACPPRGFPDLNMCREPRPWARFKEAPALGDEDCSNRGFLLEL